MRNYKELTIDERISETLQYKTHRLFRSVKARYLIALRKKDNQMIEYFERMGDNPRKIIENTRCFERAKECGFTEPVFNEYGWCHYRLNVIREIEVGKSCVAIAESPSGKFMFGLNYEFDTGGGGWSPSIWDKPYNTERDAISAGLDSLESRMNECLRRNPDDRIAKSTLVAINKAKKPVQLSLF